MISPLCRGAIYRARGRNELRPYSSLLILMLLSVCSAVEPPSLKFFKDLAETRSYTLGRPLKPALTPDGSAVIFLRGGARDPVMRLFQLDTKTGKVDEILTPDQIL